VDVDHQPAPPSAGWYPDPGGGHEQRYWDGSTWTDGVADGANVVEDHLPPLEEAHTPVGVRPPETRADLPGRAALVAGGGLVTGIALALGLALLASLLPVRTKAPQLVAGQLGLWTGLLGACVIASRRWGTGRVLADLGLRVEGLADVLRGFVISLIGRVAAVFVIVPLLLINRRFLGSNLGPFRATQRDHAALVVLTVIAVIGAPIVEELFFRGLLLRSLQHSLGAPLAVATQAVVFGLCHANPIYGLRNVSVIAVITMLGVVLGMTANHYRRLGPGAMAHGFFNLVSTLVVILSLS
jgi:membrane protease YdiL (CAAX protease family)